MGSAVAAITSGLDSVVPGLVGYSRNPLLFRLGDVEAGCEGFAAVEAGSESFVAVEAGCDGFAAVEAGSEGFVAVEAGCDGFAAVEAGSENGIESR